MRELEMNPYVIQIDKFVGSLEKLSKVFLELERKKTAFTEEDMECMCERVRERMCTQCSSYDLCFGRQRRKTYEMFWDIFRTIEEYGIELNIEKKRGIQKHCIQSGRLLKVALEVYKDAKQSLVWSQKMAESREGCAIQLDSFGQMIRHATRELNSSIFANDHLEKKIRSKFAKCGVTILTIVFFVTAEGRYEIHITGRSKQGTCMSTKNLAEFVSECCGRHMTLGREESAVLGPEYQTIIFVEGTCYHTLQGIARVAKGCKTVSGDSFSMLDLEDGKQCVILSDGMGAGEMAYRESRMVVDLLEDLLTAGFPQETAIQMLNTMLVTGREEVRFSTIDMSVFDLYAGTCSILKAGASYTFIKREKGVECVKSTSLPIGVVSKLELEKREVTLSEGDLVVMVTDGIMDALPVGEQEFLMKMIIEGTTENNPKEIAEHILEQVLECSGEVPMDDMTVIVIEIWSLEK